MIKLLQNLYLSERSNRKLLKPPVCNKVVYKDTEFIIMLVGGPNNRKDYHVNEGEEFFYQLEGNMILRIMGNEKPKDIFNIRGEPIVMKKVDSRPTCDVFTLPSNSLLKMSFEAMQPELFG